MLTAELRQCCAQVAMGLAYLHEHNICHRYTHPHNLKRALNPNKLAQRSQTRECTPLG